MRPPGARRFAVGSRSLLRSRDTPKKGEHALSADQAGRLFVTKSRRELGADADDRVSSRASVRAGSPEATASTGSSSPPVDLPHLCARLGCMWNAAATHNCPATLAAKDEL